MNPMTVTRDDVTLLETMMKALHLCEDRLAKEDPGAFDELMHDAGGLLGRMKRAVPTEDPKSAAEMLNELIGSDIPL